ncbi:membrane protein [Streptomyces spiroverticillatus]|uniref:Membrane protein n=1 Tax=Streptomyces finlayi TaxID=67296 RepID=A0A918X749_9ACTN|nr:type II secretion system F family protein [Streptomyces finlayi]GHA46442.1 membrane protein [Streptomyces spiroverticillatus]GHD16280.1 membrane protein [Streptomyces finlayi]
MIPMEAVLPAAGAGLMIGLAVKAAWPARPDLNSILNRLDTPASTPLEAPGLTGSSNALATRVGARLLGEFGGRLTLPVKDLNLLRITPAEHLGKRFLFALYGLLLPQLVQALLALAGAALPIAMPTAVSLGLAVLLWLAPAHDVKRDAAAARLIVRHAAASYLERVALARLANSGAAQALTRTAEVGDGWIFVRMRQVFDQAELSGMTPWDALRQLGEELDIPELTRPADTLALAGDGAAVYTTLQAQARQLRKALLSDTKAEANAASETMVLPVTFGVILMLAFVMIPVVNTILAS